MIFKETRVVACDQAGPGIIRCIHTYASRVSCVPAVNGTYIKASVRTIRRWPQRIRGKRFRPIRVGFVIRAFVSAALKAPCFEAVTATSCINATVLVRRRGTLRSKYNFAVLARPRRAISFLHSVAVVL